MVEIKNFERVKKKRMKHQIFFKRLPLADLSTGRMRSPSPTFDAHGERGPDCAGELLCVGGIRGDFGTPVRVLVAGLLGFVPRSPDPSRGALIRPAGSWFIPLGSDPSCVALIRPVGP